MKRKTEHEKFDTIVKSANNKKGVSITTDSENMCTFKIRKGDRFASVKFPTKVKDLTRIIHRFNRLKTKKK